MIMMHKNLVCFLIFCLSSPIFAQNTVGLISHDLEKAYSGYNLLYPHNQPNCYLLNNCGEIVHTWEDEANWVPGNSAYVTEEGFLYKAKRDASEQGVLNAPGGGAILELRDWENNLIWDLEMNDSLNRLHHDFAVMPNGNILALAWEFKTLQECIEAGVDTTTLTEGQLWPDWIFEIDPFNDTVVWEWHSWDHVIQDYDETKPNYGIIAEHPEKINLNYGRPTGNPDWMHTNSVDYNEELDQVMLSIPNFDEIWIIDHSTTTEEAASNSGGLSGMGGDLMYRWGNVFAYDQGIETDQKLFYQHDARWIDDFIDSTDANYGMISAFNNQVGPNYSSVEVFDPNWNEADWSYTLENNTFLPNDVLSTITHPDTTALFSTGLSGAQILPNGNALICSGRPGYTFELNPENELVWEFKTPFNQGSPATQGDSTQIINITFRMERYPYDYAAFEDRDLSSKGWIELEPDTSFCELPPPPIIEVPDGLFDIEEAANVKIYPNPGVNYFNIEWEDLESKEIKVFNVLGECIAVFSDCQNGQKQINTTSWNKGLYFVIIDSKSAGKVLIRD